MENKGTGVVGVSRISAQHHGTRRDSNRVSEAAWFFRISCSTFLAGILLLCAWVTVSRPLAVRKGVMDYDDSTARAPWVVPSVLVVATLLELATKSQLKTTLSSIAEAIAIRGQGLPFRMVATLAGYPGDGILSTLFPGNAGRHFPLGSRSRSPILNWKFASALSISLLLTGPLVASITYVLQPAVVGSAIVSYVGTSTACGFNSSMVDLITAGSGCRVSVGDSSQVADCLIRTAAEITGPFAAGEGTSLVESGTMRLRGSGLTVNYGVSQSTHDTSPSNGSINIGNAVASYPDRAWLESLANVPGDCRINVSRNESCGWDTTGRGAPEMKAQGEIPIYNVRVQCIHAVHFTQLKFSPPPQLLLPPESTSSPSAPPATSVAFAPSTLIPVALPSGDVASQGPLAYVQPLLGSKPAFTEILPQLKGKNSTVAFALIPAGLAPPTGGFFSNASKPIMFICGAGVYLAKQSVTLSSRGVSIEPPSTKFLDTELPINLDLRNVSLESSGDSIPRSFIGLVSYEREGIINALGSILADSWSDSSQKAISAPLHVTYGAAKSSLNQSIWLAGTALNGASEIAYNRTEKDVAQMLVNALRLISLGMSKPAWLKTALNLSASAEFNYTLQGLMHNSSLGSNDLILNNCTVLLPSVRFIGAVRLGGQAPSDISLSLLFFFMA